MKRTLLILILFALLFLLASCGDDDDKPTSPAAPGPTNSTPDSLIAAFENAYATRDSAAYTALLDSAYTFWNIPHRISGIQESWDLEEELTIAGRMFSGWANEDGASLQSIGLDLIIHSNAVDITVYPGKPEGETWRKIIANVDMYIVVDNPGNQDEAMNYMILSDQIFIVRPDPVNEGLWVVYRQEDQRFANKSDTENSSWGDVKSLFRGTKSEDASWGEVKNLFR